MRRWIVEDSVVLRKLLMDKAVHDIGSRVCWRHYTGIFLLSFATLLLELALTRVLSVANWYHFGFLVISTALLGFGASGVVLSLWTGLRERAALDRALALLSLAFSVVTVASFWLMQRIPFHPFSILLERRQLVFTAVYFLVLTAPFFCSGLGIALLFTRGSGVVGRLYAADLVGAGLGCAVLALVIPEFGGSGSVVIAAAVGSVAAAVFGFPRARGIGTTGVLLSVMVFVLAFAAEQVIPISLTPDKRHPLQPEGDPLCTGWNSFSRVDVYKLSARPERGRPDAGFGIIIDAGTSGTAMADLSAGVRNYLANSSQYRPTGLAYIGKKHPKVLIIGSGAGREVLEALYYGASSVTAVEINPIVNDIVTNRMSHYWGGLFEQPEVNLVTEDGRSFVRRSQEKYDAIISMETYSGAALSSGALTLMESYVFTREAFEDYVDHLTPDGVILMGRPAFQIPKLFATMGEIFESRALGSPANHLFAFFGPVSPFGHQLFNSGFLFKNSPFSPGEIQELIVRLGVDRADPSTGSPSPEIYYSPFDPPRTAFQIQLTQLATSSDVRKICAASDRMISPATDDCPFYNQNVRLSSLRLWNLRVILKAGSLGNAGLQPVAETMLVTMLVQSIVIAGILVLLPLAYLARHGLQVSGRWAFLGYFAALGFGFIMIEIVLLQRFVLFLGQPIYTFAVVLASLLIFTGVGSYVASLFGGSPRRLLLYWILPAVLLVIGGTVFLMPRVFSTALYLALPWRVTIAVALVAPLGFVLGMPFPTGLRIVASEAPPLVPWAWGVNGFFTVIGSVSAMILGMAAGFTAVLITAGACYLLALVAIKTSRTEKEFY